MSGSPVGGAELGAVDLHDVITAIELEYHVRVTIELVAGTGFRAVPSVCVIAMEDDPRWQGHGATLHYIPRIWRVLAESSPHSPDKWFSYVYGRLLELDSLLELERYVQASYAT